MVRPFDAVAVRAPRTFGPWSSEHLNRLLTGNGLGLLLIATCWWQVSGSGSARTQLTWLVVGIGGIGVAACTNVAWLLRGLQVLGGGRSLLLAQSHQRRPRRTSSQRAMAGAIVTVTGTRRYHRAGCVLIAGKSTVEVGPARRVSLLACEACEPT